MGFCEVSDLENLLQVTIPAAKLDAAQRAIDAATEAIKNYCRQTLEAVEDDPVTLDCTGGSRIVLPEMPVTEVSEVIEDGETLTATDDYKLGQHGILHRVGANWAAGVQVITVTYSHGYSIIPDDIVDVCARAAARAYQAGLRAEQVAAVPGVQAHSLGDYQVQFGAEAAQAGEGTLGASAAPILLASERRILDKYRM